MIAPCVFLAQSIAVCLMLSVSASTPASLALNEFQSRLSMTQSARMATLVSIMDILLFSSSDVCIVLFCRLCSDFSLTSFPLLTLAMIPTITAITTTLMSVMARSWVLSDLVLFFFIRIPSRSRNSFPRNHNIIYNYTTILRDDKR